MKIKFLKEFRLYNLIGDDMTMDEGAIDNMEKEDYAQWLIDNGFAEEVKESGWWEPKHGEKYFYIGHDSYVHPCIWKNDELDNGRLKLGLVFKTKEAGTRCCDYLKAITTIRQDEGVLTPDELTRFCNSYAEIYYVCYRWGKLDCWLYSLDGRNPIAGAIAFSTREECQASLDKHPDEWKIIANYDWSRE